MRWSEGAELHWALVLDDESIENFLRLARESGVVPVLANQCWARDIREDSITDVEVHQPCRELAWRISFHHIRRQRLGSLKRLQFQTLETYALTFSLGTVRRQRY